MTSNDNNVQLLIAPGVAGEMRCETLAWKGCETGGLLLGRFDEEGNYVVCDWIPAGPRARHHVASFEPDVDYQNHELSLKRQAVPSLDLIAMWHSHPGCFSTPSGTDLIAARSVLDDWGLVRPEMIVGIAIAPAGEFSLRTFRITAATREFREVTWRFSPAPSAPAIVHWSALPGAEAYLAALAGSAAQSGFRILDGDSTVLRLGDATSRRTATIHFPPDFPFAPARLRAGSRQLRLPVDRGLAGLVLKRTLKRLR